MNGFFNKLCIFVAITAALCVSCIQEATQTQVLNVSASYPETKSYMNGGHVKWTADDVLRVMAPGISRLSSPCAKAAAVYDFTVPDWPVGTTPQYAVFCVPESGEEPSYDGTHITAELRSDQKLIHANSFGKYSNLAVGTLEPNGTGGYSALMRNVTGLLKFGFSAFEDVKKLVIEDADGKPVAGKVKIRMDDDGLPFVDEVTGGSSHISVYAGAKTVSLGNTSELEMPAGASYYACVLPGTYMLKLTLVRLTGEKLVLRAKSPMTVPRNTFIDLGNIDEFLKSDRWDVTIESYSEDAQAGLPMHIDFSRVGYHWGEDAIPSLPVVCTLTAPEDGSDMTSRIQEALDAASSGAVLLKAGTYNVEGELVFRKNGVVLRGEGESTVIYAKGKSRYKSSGGDRNLITFGSKVSRVYGQQSSIIENAPVGQLWVRVENPSLYKVADDVALYRPATAEWISDLKMDQIPQNAENSVVQWKPSDYNIYSDRKVVRISADTVFLDNPIVMSLNDMYGEDNRGSLFKVTCTRLSECGVENIKLVSEFDDSEMDSDGNHIDEDHCWSAICMQAAEHCWVRNVTTAHFGYCSVLIMDGTRYTTVTDCTALHPVSEITGSRRYAFHLRTGQMCLVRNCRAEEDRHGFVTGKMASGPSVFASCEMVQAKSDVGPHQRWAMGVLYDNQVTDGLLALQDGCNNGTGHGWRGTNFILWNCVAETLVCQSPWVTGLNWCVGCIGTKNPGRRKNRIDGEWISHGTPVSPSSLYEWQLQQRLEAGNRLTSTLL